MRIKRIEKIVLDDNDVQVLADFADLLDNIEREIVDQKVKNIIFDIRGYIDELEEHALMNNE